MMELKDEKKYYGKWVSLDLSDVRRVVAFGGDLGEVIEEARRKGHEPIIVNIPDPDVSYVYAVA